MVKCVHSTRPALTMANNSNISNQLPARINGAIGSKSHRTPSRRCLLMLFGLGLVSVFTFYHFICVGLSALFFKLHVLQQEQRRDVSHPAYYSKVYKKDSHLLLQTPAATDVLDSSNNSSTMSTPTVTLLNKKIIDENQDTAVGAQDKTHKDEAGD